MIKTFLVLKVNQFIVSKKNAFVTTQRIERDAQPYRQQQYYGNQTFYQNMDLPETVPARDVKIGRYKHGLLIDSLYAFIMVSM